MYTLYFAVMTSLMVAAGQVFMAQLAIPCVLLGSAIFGAIGSALLGLFL